MGSSGLSAESLSKKLAENAQLDDPNCRLGGYQDVNDSILFFNTDDTTGEVHWNRQAPFPSVVRIWNRQPVAVPTEGTHFGFVTHGPTELSCLAGRFTLDSGMYFRVPGECQLTGGTGILSTRCDDTGLFCLGGPIEHTGRLRYIDGCSDTLLISPVVCGDPCLNLLYIPAHTRQTAHVHPTLRAGVIVTGTGQCCTPNGSTELYPGLAFVIPPDREHSFHTSDDSLLVVAWHPDSDTGPTHDDHPMVNRTIVDGVPASQISEIRT